MCAHGLHAFLDQYRSDPIKPNRMTHWTHWNFLIDVPKHSWKALIGPIGNVQLVSMGSNWKVSVGQEIFWRGNHTIRSYSTRIVYVFIIVLMFWQFNLENIEKITCFLKGKLQNNTRNSVALLAGLQDMPTNKMKAILFICTFIEDGP